MFITKKILPGRTPVIGSQTIPYILLWKRNKEGRDGVDKGGRSFEERNGKFSWPVLKLKTNPPSPLTPPLSLFEQIHQHSNCDGYWVGNNTLRHFKLIMN